MANETYLAGRYASTGVLAGWAVWRWRGAGGEALGQDKKSRRVVRVYFYRMRRIREAVDGDSEYIRASVYLYLTSFRAL
jgi:hypothetical protein